MKPLRIALVLSLLAGGAWAQDAPVRENPLQASASWDDLRESVLGLGAEPAIDPAILQLEAPFRAADPAFVPIHITQPDGAPAITALSLIVDENPAPVAGDFTFGAALMPLDFEVRVRVDAYSNIRAIATLADGRQVMAGRYVRASGGCAAPAGKDMASFRDTMGQMRWRKATEDGRDFGTLMIRHPNFSGLQRDQVTLLTIPAHFIQTLEVTQGQAPLMTMEAGISISEDPVFRFALQPDGAPVTVSATDTDGNHWDQTFRAMPGSGG